MTDGTRTRDNQNHNLGLYQLSYARHMRKWPQYATNLPPRQAYLLGVDVYSHNINIMVLLVAQA